MDCLFLMRRIWNDGWPRKWVSCDPRAKLGFASNGARLPNQFELRSLKPLFNMVINTSTSIHSKEDQAEMEVTGSDDWSDWRKHPNPSYDALDRKLSAEQAAELRLFEYQDKFQLEKSPRREAFEEKIRHARKQFEVQRKAFESRIWRARQDFDVSENEQLLDIVYPFGHRILVSTSEISRFTIATLTLLSPEALKRLARKWYPRTHLLSLVIYL